MAEIEDSTKFTLVTQDGEETEVAYGVVKHCGLIERIVGEGEEEEEKLPC